MLVQARKNILWIAGIFLMLLSLSLCIPLVFALLFGYESDVLIFLYSFALTLLFSVVLMFCGRKREHIPLRKQDSILLVVGIWMGVCLFGSLPFYFSSYYASLVDALFESTSGFTTTGATVLPQVEILSRPMHLWRSITHWLGGMGIVLLGLAILPFLSDGGNSLYRAEFSGSVAQRLHPKLLQTARSLWRIYLGLTLAAFTCFWFAGMSVFDAVCHAFSTLATGGFSTLNASIGGFNSPLIEYLTVIFMLLAGISFIQHFHVWRERDWRTAARDDELRTYLFIVCIATLALSISLLHNNQLSGETAFRKALFQSASILTTTGFVTADYNLWSPFSQLVLLLLMFIGGCTGSTAGGLKVSRLMLMLGVVKREFQRFTEPSGVFKVWSGDKPIAEAAISGLLNMVFIAALLLVLASIILTASGLDLISAFSAVIACQFNIGPGLAVVGPMGSYAELSALAKLTLAFCMIAGRLEFYTLIVLFTVSFWKN